MSCFRRLGSPIRLSIGPLLPYGSHLYGYLSSPQPDLHFPKNVICRCFQSLMPSSSDYDPYKTLSSVDRSLVGTIRVIGKCSFSSNIDSLLSEECGVAAASGIEENNKAKDADVMYQAVIENSGADDDMEKALDHFGLRLTTDLVVEVLHRLHFEEKVALRFFMWAGHQEFYDHEPQAYNEMIDILSTTRYKIKEFQIVTDLLDYMKRHKKKHVPDEALLTILRKYTEKHLSYLSKFPKKKFRVKTQPEIKALNLLLDALCKCCLVKDAETMFNKVRKMIKPDANTYNILFFGWCRIRDPNGGMRILEEMIKMGHTPDNFTYNTAIDTFCRAGKVTEAADLFDFMRTKGSTISSPTSRTYATMIGALVRSNRMEECQKMIEDMINTGCLPDVTTYKELIEGMCLAGKTDEAYKFLENMGNKGYPTDIVTYNCFLKVLCDNQKSDDALKLYGKMIQVGCIPSVHTFNMLISMFFVMGDPAGAFETWDEMDKRRCARDTDTYCVMIEGLFGCNKANDACFLLEEVVNKGMKLPYQKFDSILKHLSAMGDLHSIHILSEHMRKFYNHAMARRYALNQRYKSMRSQNR